MKSLILAAVALVGIIPAVANAQEAVARRNGCLNCHAVQTGSRRMPASSMTDMANRYRGQPDAEATLVKGLMQGTTNHPPIRGTEAETQGIIRWMLTLK